MPTCCFPCSFKSATDDGRQASAVKKPKPDDDLQKPTGAQYSGEAAKEFLQILEVVAQEIPVPGLGPAVKLATNLIKACEESYATLKKAEDLKMRIRMLVTVVVNELKGKKPDELRRKLKEDIETLQSELEYINDRLEEIAAQHALLVVFFRSLNEEKVTNCMARLDDLIERFTISRQIDLANLLDSLEKEIVGFYTSQKQTLDRIQDVVEVTMQDVKSLMKNTSTTAGSGSSGLRAAVPTNKNVFYGRDALVSDLAAHLTSSPDEHQQRHTCILGPGGMGKTSTALAVMAHADVKKNYPDGQQVWVPCVKATSSALLLDTLASSLGITQMTGNIKENILFVLKLADPLILLLDNFETPWNADDGRSEAEQILRDFDHISHVTLFVTMRSSTPPCGELSWQSIDLKAVDADAACQIYSKIYPESSADPQVPELLELVGHMPLAITLMATSATLTGLSAKELIDQYREIGPTLLGHGSDREHNMNICISLSVDSPPMKRSPEAQWLLAALSMLPAGTTYDMLKTWYARDLANIAGALGVLRETSLVERHGSIFSVLPVIRSYVLDPSRSDAGVYNSTVASTCKFLEEHKSSPGEESYKKDTLALAEEETNLEAVLLRTGSPSTEIMNAMLVLAKYQSVARPRTDLVAHALTLAEQMGDKSIHGAVLSCYGFICFHLSHYKDSRRCFTSAREIFLSLSDTKQAAQCLLACVESHRPDHSASYDVQISLIDQAESEFQSVNDTHGVAECWLARGVTARRNDSFDQALDLLHLAQDKFLELGSPLKSAKCSHAIAACYYWKGDYRQAKSWAEFAVQGFRRLGPSVDSLKGLLQLGFIYNARGEYPLALRTLFQSLEQSKASNGPLRTGLTLEYIGIAWVQMEKREDARGAFREAWDVYPTIPGRSDHIRCGYWLKKAEDTTADPDSEEWKALRSRYSLEELELYGVDVERGSDVSDSLSSISG